jgi:Outer membrane protein beta-barrel domain
MKHLIIFALVFITIPVNAQKSNKLMLGFSIQPELTFHDNQYSFRWKERYTKATFNLGYSAFVQYNIDDKLFVDAGLGFTSRRLNTLIFLRQSKLPYPHGSLSKELNSTKFVRFNTLSLPFHVGFNFIEKQKLKSFVSVGFAPSFLLTSYYKVGSAQYDGAYKKAYFQGVSLSAGIGLDYTLKKGIVLSQSLNYTFINPVREDSFLFSQDLEEIKIPHSFLQLNLGVKIPLKF